MATISKATITGNMTTRELVVASGAISSNATKASHLFDGFDNEHELTASTTPVVTMCCFAEITLTAGAATIDLRALVGLDGITKDFNGLEVRAIKFRAKSTSANSFTIVKGASNGFTGLGGSFSTVIPANASGGAWCMFYDAGGGTAVSATVKTFDVTGTGSQILQVAVLGGV